MAVKEKRFNAVINNKNFLPKYRKNIIVDFAHAQSTVAHTETCQICKITAHTKKERKTYNSRHYAIPFAQFRNKRHCTRPKHNPDWLIYNYFTGYICRECVEEIEKKLDFTFVKSYAP
jgi:hypothetical protein